MRGYPAPGMGTGIENGNRLGTRPVVRQSKIYRTNESGNAMKDLLGQGHLSWDEEQQEGVFKGQAVYDAASGAYKTGLTRPDSSLGGAAALTTAPQAQLGCCFGGAANTEQRHVSFATTAGAAQPVQQQPQHLAPGLADEDGTAEYPLPGSVASCDGCGQVVPRFYHCLDCQEETGLFDLCVSCCHIIYMRNGVNPDRSPLRIDHPTHHYATHRMQQVVPVGSAFG